MSELNNKSNNDIAWEKIFEKYNLLEKISLDGKVFIKSKEINEIRESRLMTKFDHKSQLPSLFKENNLSILPISRGEYIIGNFQIFHNFEKTDLHLIRHKFSTTLESIDYKNIINESIAINSIFISKILHDFTEEKDLYPTVNGRMSSSSFDFNIKSSTGYNTISVKNSQIEIDNSTQYWCFQSIV